MIRVAAGSSPPQGEIDGGGQQRALPYVDFRSVPTGGSGLGWMIARHVPWQMEWTENHQ